MKTEGTFATVLEWPPDWPVDCEVVLAVSNGQDGDSTLVAQSDGSLRLVVSYPNGHEAICVTVPVRPQGVGRAMVVGRWSRDGTVDVFLNGQKVPIRDASEKPFTLELREESLGDQRPAIGHEDAVDVCKPRIQERIARWGTSATVPSDSTDYLRVATLDEQFVALRQAVEGVRVLRSSAQSKPHRVGLDALAAMLRGLLYWEEGRAYSPLLLRLAARVEPAVPLPVWAVIDPEESASPVSIKPVLHYKSAVSPVRISPAQRLVDLQDWLESRVLIERFGVSRTQPEGTGQRHLTAKEVIHLVASERGAAHWAELVRTNVDRLNDLRSAWGNAASQMLDQAASVTVPLGQYILRKLQE